MYDLTCFKRWHHTSRQLIDTTTYYTVLILTPLEHNAVQRCTESATKRPATNRRSDQTTCGQTVATKWWRLSKRSDQMSRTDRTLHRYRKCSSARGRQTTVRWQKQVFIHTRLSRTYLVLARLSCLLMLSPSHMVK